MLFKGRLQLFHSQLDKLKLCIFERSQIILEIWPNLCYNLVPRVLSPLPMQQEEERGPWERGCPFRSHKGLTGSKCQL